MTATIRLINIEFPRALVVAAGLNVIWVNASEIFRYFAFVRDLMRHALPQLPDVAPMNPSVFLLWGIWDTLVLLAISGFAWMFFDRFGGGTRSAIMAGTLVWLAIFAVLWLGLFNMNLATERVVLTALPLAWVEMVVAAMIVDWCRGRT